MLLFRHARPEVTCFCSDSFCKSPIPTSYGEAQTGKSRRKESIVWSSWALGVDFQEFVRASQLIAPGLGTYAVRPLFPLERTDLKCLGRGPPPNCAACYRCIPEFIFEKFSSCEKYGFSGSHGFKPSKRQTARSSYQA